MANRVLPTAMHVAAVPAVVAQLIPAARLLRDTLARKSEEYRGIVKIGRTHLQEATPLTLGQEISGWGAQLHHGLRPGQSRLHHPHQLAPGRTAGATRVNAP